MTNLNYVRLRPRFTAQTDLVLPMHKGATLRGMLSTALRQDCCPDLDRSCQACRRAAGCAYAVMEERKTESGEDLPSPYVIDAADLTDRLYPAGAELAFDLVLFGPAVSIAGEVGRSLERWKFLEAGRFKAFISDKEISTYGDPYRWPAHDWFRGRLRLKGFDSESGCLPLPEWNRSEAGNAGEKEAYIKNHGVWDVKVDLTSPYRIFHKQLITPEMLSTNIFFKTLTTRLSAAKNNFDALSKKEKSSVKKLFTEVDIKSVEIDSKKTELSLVRRYKSPDLPFYLSDGLTGTLYLRNLSDRLVSWIVAGQVLQIGKLVTHGFGTYRTQFTMKKEA